MKYNSELRQDLVSGDWIVIAPKRNLRPHQFAGKDRRVKAPKAGCPFEDLAKSGHEIISVYQKKKSKSWDVQIVKNKFPALDHGNICAIKTREGPYSMIEGRGYQDMVIPKNHDKNFSQLDAESANLIFRAFQDRYRFFASDSCLAYVSIFQNWGPKAGASIYHPHYQMIAIPVVPPDVNHSLSGSARYFAKNKACVHCAMIEWEKKNGTRIIKENKGAIAFAPYVSREPFEMRIFPKKHLAYFEDEKEEDFKWVVGLLQESLSRMKIKLKDPDYNFFIHTAPISEKSKHSHYHWHIEILPKISISAGFELGTGIEITVVDPDEAAKILRS
ncbi:MAG: DUF4921 family protein [Candidatus Wolfebacteria bacterium]|nr:DUF4921 family protein [Candidatus Wolfebacteria bacterium]